MEDSPPKDHETTASTVDAELFANPGRVVVAELMRVLVWDFGQLAGPRDRTAVVVSVVVRARSPLSTTALLWLKIRTRFSRWVS